jgi:transcriptional regulator with XRE-family HTH domain
VKCNYCNGTGKRPDEALIGKQMRSHRKQSGLTLKAVAQNMGLSISFLCLLEKGSRHWTTGLVNRYLAACNS